MTFHFLNPKPIYTFFLQHNLFIVWHEVLPQRRQSSFTNYCQGAVWAAAPCGPRARRSSGSPGWQQGRDCPRPQPGAGQPGCTGAAAAPGIRHIPGDCDWPRPGWDVGLLVAGSAGPVAGQGRAAGRWTLALLQRHWCVAGAVGRHASRPVGRWGEGPEVGTSRAVHTLRALTNIFVLSSKKWCVGKIQSHNHKPV